MGVGLPLLCGHQDGRRIETRDLYLELAYCNCRLSGHWDSIQLKSTINIRIAHPGSKSYQARTHYRPPAST